MYTNIHIYIATFIPIIFFFTPALRVNDQKQQDK